MRKVIQQSIPNLTQFQLNNYLIYLAFGKDDYLKEALYSLLSFYNFHAKEDTIKVLIYTDTSDYFKKVLPSDVVYHTIDDETISSWKGNLNYIYRLKTKVLQDVCKRYTGNFLFADTDTVFLKNSRSLFQQIEAAELLLDTCEGKLVDNKGGIATKTKRFLKIQNTFSIASDTDIIYIDEQFVAWNSGTIGFTNALANTLVCVEELIDELYAKSNLFVVEQIALSYYFQKLKEPKATKDFLHHYWDFKEFRPILIDFFNHNKSKSLTELIVEMDKIHPQRLAVEKRKYKKLPFLQKQWRKITTGKKWKMPTYYLD